MSEESKGAPDGRAVVNGAASVSAVPASIPSALTVADVKRLIEGWKGIPAREFEAEFPWFLDWMATLESEVEWFPWDRHFVGQEQIGFAIGYLYAQSDQSPQGENAEGG